MKTYDLVVIGSGTAGTLAAKECREAGWSVAIIEERLFGGTCALRGCDPKKVLVGITEILDGVRRLQKKGITGNVEIDWQDLMEFKKTFTDDVPENTEKSLHKLGIHTYHGQARFVAENRMEVEDQIIEGNKILIATGAAPTKLPIEGFEHLAYSDDFLELSALPKEILFIGGGYISFELAHIAARAGATVTILHRSKEALKGFDPELVSKLIEETRKLGVDVQLSTEVTEIKKENDSYIVLGEKHGTTQTYRTNLVIHGAGRSPNVNHLQLDNANIQSDKGGILVNDFLQSVSNSNVYAAGDVANTFASPLTPVAGMESKIVSANLRNGNNKKIKKQAIPTAVFTQPKLTSVGISVAEASKLDDLVINKLDITNWFTNKRTNQDSAFAHVIIDSKKDTIRGAHLLSEDAAELINIFALAIKLDITTKQFKEMLFTYPTATSDIKYMLATKDE
ncbi:dihydrolipoyl dehydrogenase family protein [Bacillus sp. 2205SS5-2]|uniref:dihydrolipoyl dehydrogenase family protein n=1 Tax=Bacillus sp. 2205SS5-2 TaxID=3109031 RepID=UPI0030042236